jgi:hypothetical protein
MNHKAACELIERVFAAAYEETESWVDSGIGVHLAYLAWQISSADAGKVDWDVPDAQPILELFDQLFAEDDAVWEFISRPIVRHFVIVGRRVYHDAPMLSSHITAPSPKDATNKFMRDYLFEGEEMPSAQYRPPRGSACDIVSVVEIKGAPIATHVDHNTIEL